MSGREAAIMSDDPTTPTKQTTAGDWLPIETAPKGPDILLWVPETECVIGSYDPGLQCWTSRNPSSTCISWDPIDDPTRWMPLPEAPQ
jgi:hypothetical protein